MPKNPAPLIASVGRNAKWSLVQTVISALTVFALYKYLYGHLGPQALGLWAVVLASVSVGRLAEMGFSTTVLRFVSLHLSAGNRARAAHILETGVISIGLPFALLLLAAWPLVNAAMQLIVPADNVAAARELVPMMLGTLWLGVIGAIAQSALDGCGRMDVKSRILIVGNLVYVPAAIALTDAWGLPGLAACQLLQAALVAALVWHATRRELSALDALPLRWRRDCFDEIIRYAAGLQLGILMNMLFEPVTKMLLSRYCGLHEVAHFEMANQVVSRVRALIVSAMQAYLPALSSADAQAAGTARQIVGEAFTFAVGFGTPVMAGLIVAFPFISLLWIGEMQADFVAYGWVLGTGWLIATLAMPTYYFCVGTGRIRTVLLSQVLMISFNSAVGLLAAMAGHGVLVAAAMMVALVIGNVVTTRRAVLDLSAKAGQPAKPAPVADAVRVIALTALVLAANLGVALGSSFAAHLYAALAPSAVALLLIMYFSEARTLLTRRLRARRP